MIADSQEWSEPVVISQNQNQKQDVDFCIDNSGTIHCVWRVVLGELYSSIMYSKSEDNGETWSGSYNVSQNATKRMEYPHIVCDNDGTLHLTYDDDWYNTHIIYKYNDGGGNWEDWSDPDTLDIEYGVKNRLVIDNNDRLYCFWWQGDAGVFYRYRDSGNEEWSEIFNPYDSVMFLNTIAGFDNSISVLGSLSTSYPYRWAYFKFYNGVWSIPEIATPLTSQHHCSMALDNQSFPHIIWSQNTPGIIYEVDSLMYRYKYSVGWSVPVLVSNNNYFYNLHTIAIDGYNRKYIISTAEKNEMYYLNEYRNVSGQWEVSTIDSNNYTYYGPRLICKNGYEYLINFQIDTMEQYSPDVSSLIFRKKEILTSIKENDNQQGQLLQNVPNPFTCTTQIGFTLEEDAFVSLIVFDFVGRKIKSINLSCINKGSHRATFNSSELQSGIYFYAIETNGRHSQMKKMIKTE
jgi:hypothetical protein